ncbi:hypothetical protein EJ110_NYTH19500 [Nymphaea thermarum]|nr:hypothetical protein EJ110_NYTH19500 [Nymphaea thermarum]
MASPGCRGTSASSLPEHPLEVEIQDGRFQILIPKEAYEEKNQLFQWAALARLQGSSPNGHTNFSFVFLELTRLWVGKAYPKFTILTGGTFLIRVEDEQQLQCILQKRAWRVGGRSLVTHRWQPGQPLTMPAELSAPLWIRLPNLSPNMWTAQIFDNIVKGLQGDLLETDTQTKDINRGGFARIIVELPLSAPLPPHFQFVLKENHTLTQPLVYEKRLRLCRFCGVNSHPPDKCPKRESHSQGTYLHESAKGKVSTNASSSNKGPNLEGQKGLPISKNQFYAPMELDNTNEEPVRSPITTNDVSPRQDHTNRVRVHQSHNEHSNVIITRRVKSKDIIRAATKTQTNMANPFFRIERGVTHSRGRSSRLSGHKKFAQDTTHRSLANPKPTGPAGKRKRAQWGSSTDLRILPSLTSGHSDLKVPTSFTPNSANRSGPVDHNALPCSRGLQFESFRLSPGEGDQELRNHLI